MLAFRRSFSDSLSWFCINNVTSSQLTAIPQWNHIYYAFTPCLKKDCQNYFCQNFVKFPPPLIVIGTKMANRLKLCGVHSYSTSSQDRYGWSYESYCSQVPSLTHNSHCRMVCTLLHEQDRLHSDVNCLSAGGPAPTIVERIVTNALSQFSLVTTTEVT